MWLGYSSESVEEEVAEGHEEPEKLDHCRFVLEKACWAGLTKSCLREAHRVQRSSTLSRSQALMADSMKGKLIKKAWENERLVHTKRFEGRKDSGKASSGVLAIYLISHLQ